MKPHDPEETAEILARFEQHLLRVRGITPEVCCTYVRYTRGFLERLPEDRVPDLARIRPEDLVDFIASSAKRYRPCTVKNIATSVRAFLRFLCFQGVCEKRLEEAVPTVPSRRFAALPRHLGEEDFTSFLASLDSSSPLALRDRAMILCLARLGLRATEVAALHLEDIDWEQGTLHVRRRKTGRGAVLPLPWDLGRALVAYLKHGRPATSSRHVFVLHRFRVGKPIRGQVVSDAVKSVLRRTGIEAPMEGANLLRHSLATHMLNRGSSLKEIADVFGHRSLSTTAIYARVDVSALREVALPWPEVTQ